jgi:hypothetical protein
MINTVSPGLRTMLLATRDILTPGTTTSLQPQEKPAVVGTGYVCAGGADISVEQTGAASAGQAITLGHSGVRHPMHIVASASSAQYVNDAKQLQWFGKGEGASRTHFGTGHILPMNRMATPSPSN